MLSLLCQLLERCQHNSDKTQLCHLLVTGDKTLSLLCHPCQWVVIEAQLFQCNKGASGAPNFFFLRLESTGRRSGNGCLRMQPAQLLAGDIQTPSRQWSHYCVLCQKPCTPPLHLAFKRVISFLGRPTTQSPANNIEAPERKYLSMGQRKEIEYQHREPQRCHTCHL